MFGRIIKFLDFSASYLIPSSLLSASLLKQTSFLSRQIPPHVSLVPCLLLPLGPTSVCCPIFFTIFLLCHQYLPFH